MVQVSPAVTALQAFVLRSHICSLSTPVNVAFWLLPCFRAPPASLCQDFDFDDLLSLPVATGISCLFPNLDQASRILSQAGGATEETKFLQFPRWPPDGTVRPSYTYLLGGWEVGS